MRLNSKIFPFKYFKWGSLALFYEMYKTGSGMVNQQIFTWSNKRGLEFRDYNGTGFSSQIWERRRDLTGMHLRAGTVSNPPQQIIQRLANGHIKQTGTMQEIFEGLQKMLNFS